MGTLVLTGATSGSSTLTPVDAVTAVITLPSATATLATLGANTFTGTQTLTGGGSGGLILGYGGISTYGAIWSNQVSPSTSNYALFARADTTQINVPTGGAIYLGINSSTTLQVNATGAAVTGTLSATGAISPLALLDISGASAGQIKFPATQNASANANTLDDYEEGTWTPVIVNMTVVGAQTNSGKYTKIGNIVYFAAFVSAATSITWSASAIIDGLPYVGLAVPNGIASMRNNDSTQNLQGSDYSGVQNAPDFVNSRFFVGNFIATGAGVRIDFSGFYFVAT